MVNDSINSKNIYLLIYSKPKTKAKTKYTCNTWYLSVLSNQLAKCAYHRHYEKKFFKRIILLNNIENNSIANKYYSIKCEDYYCWAYQSDGTETRNVKRKDVFVYK